MALYVSDKWDSYVIENERGDEWAALDLLRQRVEHAFWYHNEDAGRAQQILESEDAPGALKFLLARADYEYEYVEVRPSGTLGSSRTV